MTKKNNHKIKADFCHASNFTLHEDAKKALGQLAARLGNYPKYMLVSFAIMYLRKEIERLGISETDDLEEKLNLLT